MRDKIVNTYMMQSIILLVFLAVICFSCNALWLHVPSAVAAVCISFVFQLLACVSYGLVWKKVSASAPDSLPTLYMAASVFRMFAGIATVIICCLTIEDKASLRFFVITFLIFYFVILAYDTYYFVMAEKKMKQNKTSL